MAKYKCSGKGIDYYQEVIIEADTADEAEDKYAEMVEQGNVLAVDYDYQDFKAEEIK